MKPFRLSLLRTIHRAILRIQREIDRPDLLSLLGVMSACTDELALREDSRFYVDHCAAGRALDARGAALRRRPVAAAVTPSAGNTDALFAEMAALTERIAEHAHALRDRHGEEVVRAYLKDVVGWEGSFYLHRISAPAYGELPGDAIDQARLAAYLERVWALPNFRLASFKRLPGGFSKTTILFETIDDLNGPQSFVLRMEPPVRFQELEGMDIRNEFPVLQFAFGNGLPVAEPILLEQDRGVLGERFIISRRALGVVYGTVSAAERHIPPDVVDHAARTMAAIHNIPLDRDDPRIGACHLRRWLDFATLPENTEGLVGYWRDQIPLNKVQTSPAVVFGLDWLAANIPTDEMQPSLIHGDFGLHNLLIHEDRVTAVLDWENSRIGDPAEELAAFLSGTEQTIDAGYFLQSYHATGGPNVSAYRLRYFAVFNCVYMMIGALAAVSRLDEFEQANLNSIVFGLRFINHYALRLMPMIELAEQARAAQA